MYIYAQFKMYGLIITIIIILCMYMYIYIYYYNKPFHLEEFRNNEST